MTALRRIAAVVKLARPLFLIGGFAGFALGAAVARFDGYALGVAAYAGGQIMVSAFHLMVHFANDYFDQDTDAITERTLWSGGSGVLPGGELPPAFALIAALACATIGILAAAAVAAHGNPQLGLVGAAIGALAWSYSAPPMRLLARGLGELDTIAVVAVLVPLAGYVTFAGRLGAHAVVATLPGACAMFAMMLSVEIPDARADAATGKRTLVVRWGTPRAVIAARIFAALAVVVLVGLAAAAFGPAPLTFAAAVPAALVALAFNRDDVLERIPLLSRPLLGVALYATTTCGALAVIAAA